ncbi:MAG: carbon-nitrogen hydrolase family protein [Eubacteriales bacterium]
MKYKIALCQIKVGMNKEENMNKAEAMIREAASCAADVIALPEMFMCPYSNKYFKKYSESEGGEIFNRLSDIAKELGIYLIAGTIPENDGEKIYNTCFAFDQEGNLIGKHRKVHLFDIDIKGAINFKESDTLESGDKSTVIDTKFGKIGIAICYDMRFPELIRKMTLEGAKLIVVPGAFNMTTGPAHWELTIRTRALDNQIYFAAVSPARDMRSAYQAFGNSGVANPWGVFSGKTDEKEGIVYSDIDLDYVDEIREQLPLLKHRREEVYK